MFRNISHFIHLSKMAKNMCKIGYAFLIVSIPFSIVGQAIPYWNYAGGGENSFYFGLWSFCKTLSQLTHCAYMSEPGSAINAVRALEIIGVLMGIVTLCLPKLFRQQSNVYQVTGGLAIFAGVLMLIGTIVFGSDSNIRNVEISIGAHLSAGFAMCVVAGAMSIFGGAFLCTQKQEYASI